MKIKFDCSIRANADFSVMIVVSSILSILATRGQIKLLLEDVVRSGHHFLNWHHIGYIDIAKHYDLMGEIDSSIIEKLYEIDSDDHIKARIQTIRARENL